DRLTCALCSPVNADGDGLSAVGTNRVAAMLSVSQPFLYTPASNPIGERERLEMQLLHHIVFSRALAAMVFCMFLVLTPRAWVETGDGVTEEVPVNVLEAPSDCLWCEPLPSAPC